MSKQNEIPSYWNNSSYGIDESQDSINHSQEIRTTFMHAIPEFVDDEDESENTNSQYLN